MRQRSFTPRCAALEDRLFLSDAVAGALAGQTTIGGVGAIVVTVGGGIYLPWTPMMPVLVTPTNNGGQN